MPDAAVVERDVRPARCVIAAVFIAHALLFSTWPAHIPEVKSRLGISDGELGTILLAVPIGSIVAIAIMPILLRYASSRALVRLCLIGDCVAGPVVGLARSPVVLFAALLLWGVFQGSLNVSMNTQAVVVERAAAKPVVAWLHGLWSLGTVAGAALGTFGVRVGWSVTTQLGLLSIVVLLVVVFPLRALLSDTESEPKNIPGKFTLSWRILALGVSAFAAMLCEGAVADWAAVYLRTNVHVKSGHAGLGFTAFAAAMVVVRLVSGRLTTRWGARNLVTALAAGATLGLIGGLASANLVGTLIGLALLGFGVGIVMPNAITSVGRLRAGRGVAIVSAFGWAGFLVGPPVIGGLAGALTLPAALIVLPVMTALIGVTTWAAMV